MLNTSCKRIKNLVYIVALLGIIAFIISQSISQKIIYNKYLDRELGFSISYLSGWNVTRGRPLNVSFYGEVNRKKKYYSRFTSCNSDTYTASIEVQKFSHSLNEIEVEERLNSIDDVIEGRYLQNGSRMVVGDFHAIGECSKGLYKAVIFNDDGFGYSIYVMGAEDRYDLIKPVFESFEIIQKI
jgi:hypothetical protein